MTDTTGNSIPPALARCIEAWNSRDVDGVVATFVEGGTYTDPWTENPLTGEAIGAHARRLWKIFRNACFELDGPAAGQGDTFYLPWKMTGTNTGRINDDLPPTGKSATVSGVSVIRATPDGLRSVTSHFDAHDLALQLGFQVHVMPYSFGPLEFGTCTRVTSGRSVQPQAFTVTCLSPRTPEEARILRNLAHGTMKEMLQMEGFIAATTVRFQKRNYSFTSWEKPGYIKQMIDSPKHDEAARLFYAGGSEGALTYGGFHSAWIQPTIWNRHRCTACDKMVRFENMEDGKCTRCGVDLNPPSYWI